MLLLVSHCGDMGKRRSTEVSAINCVVCAGESRGISNSVINFLLYFTDFFIFIFNKEDMFLVRACMLP